MSFKSVYRCLQEVFPQVDLRILKAIAIEHSTDVDAAVDFVLLEVLPHLSASQDESYIHSEVQEENFKSLEVERSSQGISSSVNSSLHSYPDQLVEKLPGTDHASAALFASSLRWEEAICDGSSVGFVFESERDLFPSEHHELLNEATASQPSETMSLTCENVSVINTTNGNFPIQPLGKLVVNDFPSVIQDGNSSYQSWIHGEVEEPIQLEKPHLEQNTGSTTVSSLIHCEEFVVNCSSPVLADIQSSFGLDVPSAVSKTFQSFPVSSLEENLGSLQFGLAEENTLSTSCNGHGEEPLHSVDTGAERLDLHSMDTIDNKHPTASISTRSGHVFSIDFLEEFVTDCKGIKTTLVSAMESIVDMMNEVDLREKEANMAKEAASKAGLDILAKVEDLKEMLKHAKEANSMHAGEVYGEKSILATEARELQSRLFSLSDDRDKSLAVIEEICQTLKLRLDVAEQERIKAEQEKLEKDEIAQKSLVEQENIMDKVVQESKMLQQEAEENSKLREFLMERGRLVDMLQGEISVICEDVLGLKERIDGRMPLSSSLSSSHILSSLASSTSSRTNTSSGKLPCSVESSENPGTLSEEILKTEQLVSSTESSDQLVVLEADHKAISDDDWEYFDGEVELSH
uniref:CUE domain-containing protein n=1 Tax=Anthurium amnicola TaxID=1678845 RepID=A0A1D1XY56_9ARAE